jgi:parallel beta-helix repeat protein
MKNISRNLEGIIMTGSALVDNNRIAQNTETGIRIDVRDTITLKKNMIKDNKVGIRFSSDSAFTGIFNCRISGNERGIISRGRNIVRRTTIDSNQIGVVIFLPGIDQGMNEESEGGYNTFRGHIGNRIPKSIPRRIVGDLYG